MISFLRGTALSASGIVGGQVILLAATPWLARMYSPSEFGIYASVMMISSVLATAGALRLDVAIPAATDAELGTLTRMALLACMTGAATGSLLWMSGALNYFPWLSSLRPSWLALACLLIGSSQSALLVCVAALVRQGRFASTAMLRIAQPLVFSGLALISVPGGLPIAFGWSVVGTMALGLCLSYGSLTIKSEVTWLGTFRKYWEYPAISMPTALLDTLALASPLLIIANTYGQSEAGNYAQVQRLVGAPLLVFAAAVAQVFYKHAGDAVRAGLPVTPLLIRTVLALTGTGTVVLLICALAGEPALTLFLGSGWNVGRDYLLLLVVPMAVRLSVSPVTSVFLLARKVKLQSCWQALYSAVTLLGLLYASSAFGISGFLLTYLVTEIAMYSVYLWLATRAINSITQP